MFDYSICNEADEEIFGKQCKALENKIPNLIKKELITDVDNSKIQNFLLNGKEIKVFNDNYVGAVYVKSEIDLLPYFN